MPIASGLKKYAFLKTDQQMAYENFIRSDAVYAHFQSLGFYVPMENISSTFLNLFDEICSRNFHTQFSNSIVEIPFTVR